jgi:hypothetical protein
MTSIKYLATYATITDTKGMKMTRKDYVLIAEVIATSWHASAEFKSDIAHNMADALAGTNPLFNRARFLDACGVK